MKDYRGDDTTGFQSPAQDYVETGIDLVAALQLRRPGLYPVRFVDDELRSRGIHAGDILITDAGAARSDGQVCVAFLHGERVLVTLSRRNGAWWLQRTGRDAIPVGEDAEIFAAVTALVRTRV